MYKIVWCTCRVVALSIHFNLLPFWRSLCRHRCGILKSLMMILFMLSLLVNYYKLRSGGTSIQGHLLWSWGCPLNRSFIVFVLSVASSIFFWFQSSLHPRRPRGGQSGWEKRRDKSFQALVKKPLGTDSHRTISKRSSECWLLIGLKKCFVLLCPIGKQHLMSSFREFVHDGYRSRLVWLMHQRNARSQESFSLR